MLPADRHFYRAFADHLLARAPGLASETRFLAFAEAMAQGHENDAKHRQLRPFVAEARSRSLIERTTLVHQLMLAFAMTTYGATDSRHVHRPPKPVVEELIEPTLREWMDQQPTDHRPKLWLYHIGAATQEPDETFAQLLDQASTDELVLRAAVDHELESVWWACHHLPSVLMGHPETLRDRLDRVEALLPRLGGLAPQRFTTEVARYRTEIAQHEASTQAAAQ